MAELTPMMQQYMKTKEEYKDCILFYRLGDFYEMFFDDALVASKELDITLTGKNCGLEERAPMCGVPFHSADTYIARLIEKGYRVAICEQTEDPAQAKGIITRAGKNTKIILLGDPNQIDRPFLDERTNGLSYAAEHMKGSPLCWQLTMTAEECERSELAMEAVKRL